LTPQRELRLRRRIHKLLQEYRVDTSRRALPTFERDTAALLSAVTVSTLQLLPSGRIRRARSGLPGPGAFSFALQNLRFLGSLIVRPRRRSSRRL